MAVTINTDFAGKLKQHRNDYGDMSTELKKGITKCVEIGLETNAPKMVDASNNLNTAGDAFCKTLDELDECMGNLTEEYSDTEEM